MNILLIDNYDSFTYNLVQLIENCGTADITIIKNDRLEGVDISKFDGLIISPGPGLPHESGLLMPFLQQNHSKIPILGVCLGLQAIVTLYGGKLKHLTTVYHGAQSHLSHMNFKDILFNHFKKTIKVGRYHSWVADNTDFPSILTVTSVDENGEVMSVSHRELPIFAVQFHPESILTPKGNIIMQNFLNICQRRK